MAGATASDRVGEPFPAIKDHVLLNSRARSRSDAALTARLTPRRRSTTSSRWFPTPGSRRTRPFADAGAGARRLRATPDAAPAGAARILSRRRSVHATRSYDYAVIRVVPRVERQEFVNAGVIVWCQEQDFLEARIELDEARVRALDGAVDIDAVRRHLASIALHLRRRRRRRHRSANSPSASASTGWWRRAAPSSRRRRCTPDAAPTWRRRWSTCWSRWSGCPLGHADSVCELDRARCRIDESASPVPIC